LCLVACARHDDKELLRDSFRDANFVTLPLLHDLVRRRQGIRGNCLLPVI